MKDLDEAIRYNAGEEAETASLLRDEAERLEREGNFKSASTYYRHAAKAEDRANVWRKLL